MLPRPFRDDESVQVEILRGNARPSLVIAEARVALQVVIRLLIPMDRLAVTCTALTFRLRRSLTLRAVEKNRIPRHIPYILQRRRLQAIRTCPNTICQVTSLFIRKAIELGIANFAATFILSTEIRSRYGQPRVGAHRLEISSIII